MTVTPSARTRSASSSTVHTSSGRITTVAPAPRAGRICSREASKEWEAKFSTRSSAVRANRSRAAWAWAASAWCSTPTALGRPVEPEVKMR